MTDSAGVILQLQGGPDDDTAELAELTQLLRGELLDLDVAAVEPVAAQDLPAGAKGAGVVVGWLAVNLGPEALRAVLMKISDWVDRSGRGVEVTRGGETLKLTRATRAQQEKLVDDWLDRHPAGA
jgi:hypothetical protein